MPPKMSAEFLCIAVPVTQASSGIIVVASFTPPSRLAQWVTIFFGLASISAKHGWFAATARWRSA